MRKLYFLSLVLIGYFLQAQQISVESSPGGVLGAVVWMKTVPGGKDLYGQYKWQDYSGDSLIVRYYDQRGAQYGTEYKAGAESFVRNYNFNPGVSLNWGGGSNMSKEIWIKSSNLSTATVIGAVASKGEPQDKLEQPAYMMVVNSLPGKGVVLNTDKIINSHESARGILDYGAEEGYDLMYHNGRSPEPTKEKFKERTLRSFVYYRTTQPDHSVWGDRKNSVLTLGDQFYSFDVNNKSTYDITGTDGSKYESYIPELFIYDRILNPLERVKTESYLALKYGFMLERSFIGSRNQLLWDIEQNQKYNYRVTGMYRDDLSALYQLQGSTSYEETPYFSYSVSGDSYEGGNRYGLSNRYRLLVMERFPANTMEDTEYAIWGDNNQSIKTVLREDYLGMKIMERNWLVKTNMGGKIPEPEGFHWVTQDVGQVSQGYKTTFHKLSTDTSSGLVVSKDPLQGYEGHISFTVGSLPGYSHVKFGGSAAGTNTGYDYGIYIDETGKVYPIIKSTIYWNNAWGVTVKEGDRIRINKTKESFIVSSNGWALPQTGQALPQIDIAIEDQDKLFYVGIVLHKSSKDVWIKDVRTGGFIDTGNRIELSYFNTRAAEFADYASNGQAYMLVDRSGTGEFKREDTEMYISDEHDTARKKIVFNNVFFDTDANGKDVFTFGYRKTNLIANVEKANPGCDSSGNSENNGIIDVEIVRGDEGFEYQLVNKENSDVEKSGVFFGENLKIDSLSSGNYTLKLKEIGGFNMISDSTSVEAKGNSHAYVNKDTTGQSFETTLKSTDQHFQIGFTPHVSDVASIYLPYGIEINNGKIYIIYQNIKNPVPVEGIQLKTGDKLRFVNINKTANGYKGIVEYQVNGVTYNTIQFYNNYYFMIRLNDNVGAAHNVKNTGATLVNWNYQGVHLKQLSESSVEHSVVLEADCADNSGGEETPDIVARADNNLVFYYKDFSNQSEITANIKLKQPSVLMIALFDFSGNMVYSKNITERAKEHTIDLVGLRKGVYIAKVFTAEGEFTKKISIN